MDVDRLPDTSVPRFALILLNSSCIDSYVATMDLGGSGRNILQAGPSLALPPHLSRTFPLRGCSLKFSCALADLLHVEHKIQSVSTSSNFQMDHELNRS